MSLDKMTSLYKNKYDIIILIISVTIFTHLFNPIGFPSVHVDEGIYVSRNAFTNLWKFGVEHIFL